MPEIENIQEESREEVNDESQVVNRETSNVNEEATNQTPDISTSEIQNMEVHHHPNLHHKRKNFNEYFLEFLMIFLAVTLGFFAEGLREYTNDKSKEHEYISALRKDLVADTVNLSIWMRAFNTRINDYDTLINLLRHPENITDGSDLYYRARLTTRGTVFENRNNTMIQLSVSGNFRLISNKVVAEKIIAYENDIDNYKNVGNYDAFEAKALYDPESKLFDAFVFNDMSKPITDSILSPESSLLVGFRNVFRKPKGNPQLLTTDKQKINDFVYILHQRRSTFAAEVLVLYKQKTDAAELIHILDREYHLKSE